MTTKSQRFDLEWLVVSKRSIYAVIFLAVLSVGGAGFGLYVWIYGNPFKSVATETPAPAGARFDSFEGDVSVVRAQTREKITARADTQLYPGDLVQTQADGRARISLADGSILTVKPNSVITIAENTSSEDGRRANVRVAVESGQINLRTEQMAEGTMNIVGTKLSENRLAGQTNASFDVRDDKTEAIRVASGTIETNTRGGEKMTIGAGQYVAINQSGNIKSQEKLLDAPGPVTPRNLERLSARANGSTNVPLRWQRPASGMPAHYRVEVATSPFFVAAGVVIERDQLYATEFTAGDLRPGNYFWRVRAAAASGQTSEWSDPQKFIIVAGGDGGQVKVSDVSLEFVGGDIYLVRGRTQPGNTVRSAGRETLAARDGSFKLQVTMPRSAREFLIEAEDAQGNRGIFRQPFAPDAAQR